jgi:hypothetical protein
MALLVLMLCVWGLSAPLAPVFAHAQGRNWVAWVGLGLLFGPIAVALAAFLPSQDAQAPQREAHRLVQQAAEGAARVQAQQAKAARAAARRRRGRRALAKGYLVVTHPELAALAVLLDKDDGEARRD